MSQRSLIITLLFLLATLTPAFAGDPVDVEQKESDVAVSSVGVSANLVSVTLANRSDTARTATVRVLVIAGGAPAGALQTVQVGAKSEAGTTFLFGAEVTDVIHAGLVDDGDPW